MSVARRFDRILPAKSAPLPGGASVMRALPRRECRALGPWVFLDHAGPTRHAPGAGMYVPPHPHAGLETVTWLLEGALLHKDSLGNAQVIRPGDVNWMTSGRGIVHSEETEPTARAAGHSEHLVQLWVALPAPHRGVLPHFAHHPAASLPRIDQDGTRVVLIAGDWSTHRSPVHCYSPLACLDVTLPAGAEVLLPWTDGWDAGVYVVDGDVAVAGETARTHDLVLLGTEGEIALASATGARLMLIGGAPLADERAIWGNFVLGSVEECKQAQAAFEAGAFGSVT